MTLEACFVWPGPICPRHGDGDHDQRIILELTFLEEGGGGGGGGVGVLEKRPKDVPPDKMINEPSLINVSQEPTDPSETLVPVFQNISVR